MVELTFSRVPSAIKGAFCVFCRKPMNGVHIEAQMKGYGTAYVCEDCQFALKRAAIGHIHRVQIEGLVEAQ